MPHYEMGSVLEAQKNDAIQAVLAIGDEALVLAQAQTYPYMIDLSKIWYEETSLPFVFAIWAMRQEFCRNNPEVAMEIHHELLRCRNEGKQDLKNIWPKSRPTMVATTRSMVSSPVDLVSTVSPSRITVTRSHSSSTSSSRWLT